MSVCVSVCVWVCEGECADVCINLTVIDLGRQKEEGEDRERPCQVRRERKENKKKGEDKDKVGVDWKLLLFCLICGGTNSGTWAQQQVEGGWMVAG